MDKAFLRFTKPCIKGCNFKGYFTLALLLCNINLFAQGTWSPLKNQSPQKNAGVMILLSDGTVMAKSGNMSSDSTSANWLRLSPDHHGSYVDGTWSDIAPMKYSRLYFSSQVLMDGRVYVAGGEYGSGVSTAEMYDPIKNTWTEIPTPGTKISDANSEILPDGKILQAMVGNNKTIVYNPKTNSYTNGPTPSFNMDESSWLKLPDNSILFVGMNTKYTLRYIPQTNRWVHDANVPVALYDPYGSETGAAFLLPNGKGLFIGATGHTAIYTPTGDTLKGSWEKGPELPDSLSAPDAAAAMMVNGKILCAFSPLPDSAQHFHKPTYFFEYDYVSNSFIPIEAPDGNQKFDMACYNTNMLDLPDGNVLYASQGAHQYYIYNPNANPLEEAKPKMNEIIQMNCDSFYVTGTLFNGISEGASYGDDWQMNSNYPLIRIKTDTSVTYLRTFNWSRTGVQTGELVDTTYFTIPKNFEAANYQIELVVNGVASTSLPFDPIPCHQIAEKGLLKNNQLFVFPNPAFTQTTLMFQLTEIGEYKVKVIDMLGRLVLEESDVANTLGTNYHTLDVSHLAAGEYIVLLQSNHDLMKSKLLVR